MKKSYSNIFLFNKKILNKTLKLLEKGNLVGLPTETVYGLAGNAYSNAGVKKIFKLKGRPKLNPLIVHYYNIQKASADIVVNTDGDNQYNADDIKHLIEPIINGGADFVVGCRPIKNHPEFTKTKILMQLIGSWVLRKISKTDIPDAASGFRAYSRETCLKLNIYTSFSHCMETLIQAGNSGLKLSWVDIRVNSKTRDSRLFSSIPQYIFKSAKNLGDNVEEITKILLDCCLNKPSSP